jgi:hypothetical protein
VLLERRVVQPAGGQQVDLEFLAADQVRPGWRQVHGGASLLLADTDDARTEPARLQFVPGFQMTERELHLGDVERWTGVEPPPASGLLQELTWNRIVDVLDRLNAHEAATGSGFYVALPTPEEWLRAGQGVDARPFPWGAVPDWRFSQNYWSTIDARHRLRPHHWPEQDCSPFGIRDLAGSLREVCLPSRLLEELGTKQFLVAGGSYLATTPRALQLAVGATLQHHEPAYDVGLRLVRRPVPAVPRGPARLDLADAAAGGSGAAGWRVAVVRGPMSERADFADHGTWSPGRLELRGLAGSFSPNLLFWHPVDLDAQRAHAKFEFTIAPAADRARGIEFRLGTQPGLEAHDARVVCMVAPGGWSLDCGGGAVVGEALELPDGEPLRLALSAAADDWCATLATRERVLGTLRARRSGLELRRLRYVGVLLPTLVGRDLVFTGLHAGAR